MKEEREEVKNKSGTITADALAKLRKDARGSAASKKECRYFNVAVIHAHSCEIC